MLALAETKLKGEGEVSWCGANDVIAGVQEMERPREGVAIPLNDMFRSAVVYFGCANSRILWIKFKFSRAEVCVVVGYRPNEGNGEEKDRF